jgi:ankyrin repeat protein
MRKAAILLMAVGSAASAASGAERSVGDQLAIAIEGGDLAKVKSLVEAGNPPDTPIVYGENQQTPLFKAAGSGQTAIVKYLLSKGANANFKTADFGQTPLSEAVTRGFDDTVEALLAGGADQKVGDRNGYTPFALAVIGGKFDVAELLLAKGADLNGTDSYGNTWLLACATMGNPEAIRWLAAKGADVNRVFGLQYGGNTALTMAARVGQVESVRALLELGANPHLKMKDGSTALGNAEQSKNAEAVALIKAALAKPPPAAGPKKKPAARP